MERWQAVPIAFAMMFVLFFGKPIINWLWPRKPAKNDDPEIVMSTREKVLSPGTPFERKLIVPHAEFVSDGIVHGYAKFDPNAPHGKSGDVMVSIDAPKQISCPGGPGGAGYVMPTDEQIEEMRKHLGLDKLDALGYAAVREVKRKAVAAGYLGYVVPKDYNTLEVEVWHTPRDRDYKIRQRYPANVERPFIKYPINP